MLRDATAPINFSLARQCGFRLIGIRNTEKGGLFKIVGLLPEAENVVQCHVKSETGGHERVVQEDQLARV